MNLRIRLILLPWIIAMSAWTSSAADEAVERFLRQSPTAQEHPEASAVVLFAHKTMVWQPETGQLTEDIHSLVKVLRREGRDRFGDYVLFYRQGEQQVKLLRAGTWRADGGFVPVEGEAVRDLPSPESAVAGIYGDALQKVVSLPAVDVGALLETHVERITGSRPLGFSGIEYFQSAEPLVEKRFHVVVPKGRPFVWRAQQGDGVQLVRSSDRGFDVYSFYAADSPAVMDEPSSPPLARTAARVLFSAYRDWNEAARPFAEPYWVKVRNCPAVDAFTAELLAGAGSPEARLEKIFTFVTRQVRSVALSLHRSGYEPHDPDVVLANRYGDAKDKAILMGAMLLSAGFEAQPVFLNSQYLPLVEEVPALEQFDAIVMRVSIPGGNPIFLDPFGEYDAFGWGRFTEGNRGLVVRMVGCAVEAIGPAATGNAARNLCTIRLTADGATEVGAESSLEGAFAAATRLALRDRTPAEIDRFFLDSARLVSPDATVTGSGADSLAGTGRVVTLRLRFRTEDLGILQGGVMILDLPAYPFPMGEIKLFLGQPARKTPIELGQPAISRLRVEISLPEGTEVLHLPAALEQATPEWAARRTIRHVPERGLIEVDEEVQVLQRILPAAGYGEARSFFSRWLDRSNSLLILRMPGRSSAPAGPPGGEAR